MAKSLFIALTEEGGPEAQQACEEAGIPLSMEGHHLDDLRQEPRPEGGFAGPQGSWELWLRSRDGRDVEFAPDDEHGTLIFDVGGKVFEISQDLARHVRSVWGPN